MRLLRTLALVAPLAAAAGQQNLDCAACQLIVTVAQDIAENATSVGDLISALDAACASLFPTSNSSVTICDDIAAIVAAALPWVDKQLSTLAWPIPLGFCSVFVPVCLNPCCGTAYNPEQIHLALTDDASQMTVTWITLNATATSVVQFGPAGANASQVTNAGWTQTYTNGGWVGVVHTAVMTGLEVGAAYSYRVGDGAAGFSAYFTFSTLPADVGSAARPLRVVQLGDTAYDDASDFTIATIRDMVEQGIVDLVLHIGDIGYADGFQPHWDLFFNKIQPIATAVPYMTAPGNHEFWFDFQAYRSRFIMPQYDADAQQSMYYSFNAGPLVHFVMLNTESPIDTADVNATEVDWLVADLATANANRSAASNRWIIAGGHRPFYCSNNDKTQCGTFSAVLRFQAEAQLGAGGVDLVLTAHEHGYERTWPVRGGNVTQQSYVDADAPVYVVQGAGGNREGNELPNGNDAWSVFQSGAVGFAYMEVAGPETLTYSFLAANGTLIDSFNITKTK